MTLAANIKRLRHERDLTQEQLAKRAGVHREQISLWEAGTRPQAWNVHKLARALGVTVKELTEGVGV